MILAEPRSTVDELIRKRDMLPDQELQKRFLEDESDENDDPDTIARKRLERETRIKNYKPSLAVISKSIQPIKKALNLARLNKR